MVKSYLISFCEIPKLKGSKRHVYTFFKNPLYEMFHQSEEPPPSTHYSRVAFSVIKWIKSAIFSLLSAATVTYSGHRWLLTPKEVINKPPEWLLKTSTLEKFLWTQKMSVRPWHVAGVHCISLWFGLSPSVHCAPSLPPGSEIASASPHIRKWTQK